MASALPNSNHCLLEDYMNCSLSEHPLTSAGPERLNSIVEASKRRGDGLYSSLEPTVTGASSSFLVHRNCVSTYTSKTHIKRYLLKQSKSAGEPDCKRSRRSSDAIFNFKEHCLICGEVCLSEPEPKHRDRWRRVVQCRTADRGPNQDSFKDVILKACEIRNDEWAEQVKLRVEGALTDLHAADAQYHKDCMSNFRGTRNLQYVSKKSEQQEDNAFIQVIKLLTEDRSRIWNSIEVHDLYISLKGEMLSRRSLLTKLSEHFGRELLVLSGAGVASIITFRSKAVSSMKLVADENDDDDAAVSKVAKRILAESKKLKHDKFKYKTRVSFEEALDDSSQTLLHLLSMITTKLDSSLPAAMIGNIVTNAVTNQYTSLQIALGVTAREKTMIECLSKFGVAASYDEIKRFKASAANAAAQEQELTGIKPCSAGFVQTVADNFDANISSQNGLQSTHALAILLTQTGGQQSGDVTATKTTEIRRLRKEEISEELMPDVPVQRYRGPSKPEMPVSNSTRSPLPLKVMAAQIISLSRAQEIDLAFLKQIISDEATPEYHGYNTKISREQGHSIRPPTKAVYLPLLDMTPAEPDTMYTAMVEAQRLTNQTGQVYTIFTNDQQLYRVVVHVTWVHPNRFMNFIPRLGGMHTLMNFTGAVGSLMADTGLETILQSAFGGVGSMLSGKKFPQNIRALRLLTEELLRGTIEKNDNINSYDKLLATLNDKTKVNRTAKLWVDNLIRPVLIMMMFVRAEREADWPLHLWCVKEMMPFFFAAGHFNYARYCLYYLHSMEKLPSEVLLQNFLQGNHVMRHQPGLWNAIWSDMFIESTFMRYGHSPGGIIGLTLKPSTMKRWALSLHVCSRMVKDVAEMTNDYHKVPVTVHKEEMPARKKSDAADREKLRERLTTCIDPLNPDDHCNKLVNIVTGKLASDAVNVDVACKIGLEQMKEYETAWPSSFHKPLSKKVITMKESRKKIKIEGEPVYDTNLIYSRVLGLQTVRDINLQDVMKYELAPIPTSIFEENGDMHITKTKSVLKKKLQVEISDRMCSTPSAIIIDGCAILWVIQWPTKATVEDFIVNLIAFLNEKLKSCDTYLIFDRYHDNSIKRATRTARAGKEASRRIKLGLKTPLPAQKIVLTVTENKIQLINLICSYIANHVELLGDHRLILTGQDSTPIEVFEGKLKLRHDLYTTHEEADVVIVQQVVHVATAGSSSVKVISDDTDVFVLLLHYYQSENLKCDLVMTGTSHGRTSVDVKASVAKFANIIPELLSAHALTGCDTVSCFYGIGKATVVKCLKEGYRLNYLGHMNMKQSNLFVEATTFIAACYGSKERKNMTAVRFEIWSQKMAHKRITAAPSLKTLPPTTEAFEEHVIRAHVQAAIWRSALETDPPAFEHNRGWTTDGSSNGLVPVPLPPDVRPAPDDVLKMIRCGCSSAQPCATSRCSCSAARLSCTLFCSCHGNEDCFNVQTKMAYLQTDGDLDDESDE